MIRRRKESIEVIIIYTILYLSAASGDISNTTRSRGYFSRYFFGNRTVEVLQCYGCTGAEKCGLLFSPNLTSVKVLQAKNEELLYSCSVRTADYL